MDCSPPWFFIRSLLGGTFIHIYPFSIKNKMKKFQTNILHRLLLLMLVTISAVACMDDETFTSGTKASLSFSRDTVSFDTVFVNVSSSTERLNVFNHSSEGLEIKNVRLQSGGTSGFRMNVDGQFGTSIDGVQIQKKDSIFIFVEVNVSENSLVESAKVTDAIVFTLTDGEEKKVVLEAYGQQAQVLKAEVVKESRMLNATLPYLIYDSLVVDKDACLTIPQGTALYFHNGASLIVHGELKVEGTAERPVAMRGDRLEKMFPYLPYDRLENQWGGILLTSSCQGCTINHADIHSGNYGILCDGIEGNVSITNSIIHNVAGYGLYLKDSKALVANTQISNTKYDCVSIYGGTTSFIHCTLAQFYPWTADRGHALYVSNYVGIELHMVESSEFYNCFITGYANDEVYGNPGEQALNLHFHHCVLLTDVKDETYFSQCIAESPDSAAYKEKNFKMLDTHAYYYDFHLDTLSVARGKGNAAYSSLYPTDLNGVERKGSPDVGCYQFK